jgi:hypothetical protein
MKQSKKRGGKREGAGRKPLGEKKVPATVYVHQSHVEPIKEFAKKLEEGRVATVLKQAEEKIIPALYGPLGECSGDFTLNTVFDLGEIQKQIDTIRAEKIPKERDTPLGRKVWQQEQDAKIKELQNKLK